MRQMVFISHANPDDNEFTLWLTLRLAREGYGVWCDLTKLLGGETFWRDIETAIRDRTVKFVYVLSRTSNVKEGPLNELNVALNVARDQELHDFVIPLHIDDLPFRDINIQISRLNAIECNRGWASGLHALLKKLAEENVPKDDRFGAEAVAAWWRANYDGAEMVRPVVDDYLSNWFPIRRLPETLHMHLVDGNVAIADLSFPAHRVGDYVVSFAPAEELGLEAIRSSQVLTEYALQFEFGGLPVDYHDRSNAIARLLRLAWGGMMQERGVPRYELANGLEAGFFTADLLTKSRISFALEDGFTGRRGLTGRNRVWSGRLRRKVDRHWHFAITANARLRPQPLYAVKTHVLFSTDGKTIWDSKKQLQRIRRTHCKEWWNDDWRDRLLAAVAWIAGGATQVEAKVSCSDSVAVATTPMRFSSPVSYDESVARRSDSWAGGFDDEAAEQDETDHVAEDGKCPT